MLAGRATSAEATKIGKARVVAATRVHTKELRDHELSARTLRQPAIGLILTPIW